MTLPTRLLGFAGLRDTKALPDPHQLAGLREQILWVLAVTKDSDDLGYLTPAEIADLLRESEGIPASRQAVAAILAREKSTVAKRRQKSRDRFKIMRVGEELLLAQTAAGTAQFVDPENSLNEIRKLEALFATLTGDVKICDPYIDNKTVDLLVEMSSADSIQLLTVNVQKDAALKRDLAAYLRQGGKPVEVRIASEAALHDRYIIHAGGMILLGGSLNGFSKKQSFIVSVGPDLKTVTEAAFDKHWRGASHLV